MTLTHRDKRWYKETPLDRGIVYAAETPSGYLFTVRDGGRVLVNDVELSDANSLALHDYSDPTNFKGYTVPHSGEGPSVVEDNGYISGVWMGAAPDPGYGTPIYMGVFKQGKGAVRYLLGFAGEVIDHEGRRGPDNHCFPQVFGRESDRHIVYLGGAHNGIVKCGVSAQPHAFYSCHGLYPVGPQGKYTIQGHTYPAARMVGDTLHVVSRHLDGDYRLVYWAVDTTTMQTTRHEVLDSIEVEHTYAIWYQQPYVKGDTLIVPTSRIYTPKGEKPGTYTDPEPKTFEVKI